MTAFSGCIEFPCIFIKMSKCYTNWNSAWGFSTWRGWVFFQKWLSELLSSGHWNRCEALVRGYKFRVFLMKKQGSTFLVGIININIQHQQVSHNQLGVRQLWMVGYGTPDRLYLTENRPCYKSSPSPHFWEKLEIQIFAWDILILNAGSQKKLIKKQNLQRNKPCAV